MPNQVIKAYVARAEGITTLQNADECAVGVASSHKNKVKLAEIANSKFNIKAVPQTLHKLIREGRIIILAPGPRPPMDESMFKNISAALSSHIAISQVNGDLKKDKSCIISALELLLKKRIEEQK
jgi:hypothetical protein